MKKKPIYNFFKRMFDLVFSFLAIAILLLPMMVVGIAIKVDSKGPVFFKQVRIGKNKKVFKILKFRSMFVDTDPNLPTHQLKDPTTHITKVGAFIRKTSVDELPQLFNILVGQMSFVGPRPALWNQTDLIAERDRYHANEVKPGLTGLAQISGRDELEIPVKAKLDGEYVEKRGLSFDIGIVFKTIFPVLKHEGVVEGMAEEAHKDETETRAFANTIVSRESLATISNSNHSSRRKSAHLKDKQANQDVLPENDAGNVKKVLGN